MKELEAPSNVWKKMLEPSYATDVRKLDWYGAPGVREHAEKLAGGDWMIHARDNYLRPLAQRRQETNGGSDPGLSMISFGCGGAWSEKRCLDLDWPIRRITCLEFDHSLLNAARENLSDFDIDKYFMQFDFNETDDLALDQADVIFFSASLHHCTNLEKFLPFMNRALKEDGLVLGYDYFGPCRFQLPYEISLIVSAIYECLPDRLKKNLVTGEVEQEYVAPYFQHIMSHDSSESARSSDLRSLFFGNFPVLEYRPMGGTLLSPLLTYRSGNYVSTDDVSILKMIMLIERTFIERGLLPSNDLYFVCGKSRRI